jgi:hypothetical protein
VSAQYLTQRLHALEPAAPDEEVRGAAARGQRALTKVAAPHTRSMMFVRADWRQEGH